MKYKTTDVVIVADEINSEWQDAIQKISNSENE
jgi:hypothetical protein